jgi:hypothetical protein
MPVSVNHSNSMGSILLCGLDGHSRRKLIFKYAPLRRDEYLCRDWCFVFIMYFYYSRILAGNRPKNGGNNAKDGK